MTVGTHDIVRRCRAHRTNGDPCSAHAIRGGTVCVVHGGRAPQVKKAAAERIAEMVDPALTELRRLVDMADTDTVRLAAIKDVLDRAGYKPREKVDVNMQVVKTIDKDAWDSV